jgi:predicted DNA-binding transcriptional regulator AlpA
MDATEHTPATVHDRVAGFPGTGHDRAAYPSLKAPQVADRLGISEATLYRYMRKGIAPPSYQLGGPGGPRLWRESDVLEWLEKRCRSGGAA